jgi:hypothetical protein
MSISTPDPRGPQAPSTIRTRCIRCGGLWPASGFYPKRPRTCIECHKEAVDLSRAGMPKGARRPRAALLPLDGVRCIACLRIFYPKLKSAQMCSGACRVEMYRRRKRAAARIAQARRDG